MSGPTSWVKPVLIALAVGLVVLAASIALVPIILFGAVFGPCLLNPHSFEAAGWASADPYENCSDRSGMVDDVRGNYLRTGMSRAEVRALLGPPDFDETPRELEWAVGCWIDCDWLVVRFAEDQTLLDTRVYQD